MKFGINFTSCTGNGNFAIIATTSGIYPKKVTHAIAITINTMTSLVIVKISDFQTCFNDECALPTPVRHAVKVENRSGLIILCLGQRLTHFPAE